ncbi:ribonuclease M5 [Limosilactobacillus equigenerosi]|uniref:Ribonuclease M5 n=1 Tax=Limosilactobacillus equigenerosi DSM 18793 = JCM 14505 TaxID=1423742 RepID=A0A0R1UX97_9LACO|nr:ribonuclease M5 [Limosilactobacillus equigenerosi]KRL94603.1 Ribonuclease M5 [Limosilactobacillus equigenerosi DSM 18793 = JCM 14505]
MPKIKEVIVVEGQDDTKNLQRFFTVDTFETNGSAINQTDLAQLKQLQAKRGLIVFTDPDFNGERIRKIITQAIPDAKHAFLPRQAGVPKKKGGSLGVEHANEEALTTALTTAKVSHEKGAQVPQIPTGVLLQARLLGHPSARARRERLGELLGIGYTNGKQLKRRLAMFQITPEALVAAIHQLDEEE